ncbi:hypothetical protein, partial [Pseudomonas viridiflava]|uniref:hypothetical protein n=1 Tax=Pseudomonas viridiflava TaxID=33069 RepID=UPI00197E3A05
RDDCLVSDQERARSILGGISSQSESNDQLSDATLIVPIAPRGYASRDAPRHKWHRLRIQ